MGKTIFKILGLIIVAVAIASMYFFPYYKINNIKDLFIKGDDGVTVYSEIFTDKKEFIDEIETEEQNNSEEG